MARAPATTIINPPPAVAEDIVRAELSTFDDVAAAQAQQEAGTRALAVRLGYQLPADSTDPDLIQRDIAANMRRSVEACLEVGRGLAVLKQTCGHGNFISRLDVLGIEESVARRFMQAATKFSNRASTHVLKAVGNQTKLFEMMILDDEQLEELELTGQTGELKLDDVATMSVKELRTALREAREQSKAKDRLLADKNEKIDALSQQDLIAPPVDPTEAKVGAFKAEIAAGFDLLDDAVGKLYLIHSVILQEDVTWGGSEEAERIILRQFATLYGDRLDRLVQQFAELRDHYEATLAGWRGELDTRSLHRPGEPYDGAAGDVDSIELDE